MIHTRHPVWTAALRAPETIFRIGVSLRNRWYERPGAARRGPIPVVSVGNLTLGGTGKTPLVAWLAERAIVELGKRAAIVSRGYGGRAGRGPLLVADGSGARVGPDVSGDEPFLLHRLVPDSIVVVGADRLAGVNAAARAGAELAILDDGFQHRRLARDLDVVVLDGEAPFGNGHLLPAGPLREPPASLARAHLVVVHRPPDPRALACVEDVVRRLAPACEIVVTRARRVGFVDRRGRAVDTPRRAVAFCGIGKPEPFRRDLVEAGVEIASFRAWPDHHRYTETEVSNLAGAAAALGACLVTTEKDLARLEGSDRGSLGPWDALVALRIATAPDVPGPLLSALRRVAGAGS